MDFSVQQHLLPPIVILVMVAVGMELRVRQFQKLFETPRVPILGTLIHTLSFPMVAVGLVISIRTLNLNVPDATLAGILLIAACPSGGFSNVLVLVARANLALSVVLTAISSLLAFLTVPLLVAGFSLVLEELDRPIAIPVTATLVQLVLLVVLPIGLGMLLRYKWPAAIDRIFGPLQNVGQILLYIAVVLLVIENLEVVQRYAFGALPWSLALCALTMLLCYQSSRALGLSVEDRVTIALEGSIRNLAVALLIAVNGIGRMDIAVLPTVYFVAVMILAMAFAKLWPWITGTPQKG